MADYRDTAVIPRGPRRDPRRLFTPHQLTQVADRQDHVCADCDEDLPEVFQIYHIVRWSEGGRTRVADFTTRAQD
jgi:hypothetical protein